MRTNKQAEIIVFKKEGKELIFLILKRNPQKGGFWQPITGGVEENETFQEAAIREVGEEIGVTHDIKLIDIGYRLNLLIITKITLKRFLDWKYLQRQILSSPKNIRNLNGLRGK